MAIHNRLTESKRAEIVREYKKVRGEKGAIEKVKAATGLSASVIYSVLNDDGIKPNGVVLFTNAESKTAKELWESGLSVDAIAEKINRHESTNRRSLKKSGVTFDAPRPITATDEKNILKDIDSGKYTARELSKKWKRAIQVIYEVAKRNNRKFTKREADWCDGKSQKFQAKAKACIAAIETGLSKKAIRRKLKISALSLTRLAELDDRIELPRDKRFLPPEVEENIVEDAKTKTVSAIARDRGVQASTVARVLNRHNITPAKGKAFGNREIIDAASRSQLSELG